MAEKKVNYFSHDYNARNDPKILRLRKEMSVEGIGIYWSLIEILYEQGGFILDKDVDAYADSLSTDSKKIRKVLENFELFTKKGKKYVSKSAEKRLKVRREKSEKAKKSVSTRWNNKNIKNTNEDNERNTNVLQTYYEGNTINKGKEIKEINKERKEGKEKEEKMNLPPAATDDKFSDDQPAELILLWKKYGNRFKLSPVNARYLKYDIDYYAESVFRKNPRCLQKYETFEKILIAFINSDIDSDKFNPRMAPVPEKKKESADEFSARLIKKYILDIRKIYSENPEFTNEDVARSLVEKIINSQNGMSKEVRIAINRYTEYGLYCAIERVLNYI